MPNSGRPTTRFCTPLQCGCQIKAPPATRQPNDSGFGKQGNHFTLNGKQAYWLQLETEWLRAERSLAGVLHFCYLTNNYGFTGDDFTGPIADLHPAPIFNWFRHCFAPSAVFINLTDERYRKNVSPHAPGSTMNVNLIGVTDNSTATKGQVTARLLNSRGKAVQTKQLDIDVSAFGQKSLATTLKLTAQADGYLLLAEYRPKGQPTAKPVLSRRYIKVGQSGQLYPFYELTGVDYQYP